MIIKLTRVTGDTASADSSGDQGMGGGIANINLVPVATGGVLTIIFSQVSRNMAFGRARWDLGGHHYQEEPERGRPADL